VAPAHHEVKAGPVSRPTIVTVDDDPQVSAALTRDLKRRYGEAYRVLPATSGAHALELLTTLALRADPVALIVADQRMPQMTGIELLGESRSHAPDAKLLLLTAYADTDVAISAINEIGLDYYLLKPWDPPTERLFPVVDDLLGDWRQAHPELGDDVQVIGDRWSDRAHDLKTFLARNHVPYRWDDVERDDEGRRLHELAGGDPQDLPLVLVPGADPLRAPTVLGTAAALGLHTDARSPLYDVCIVGGGPAGLAAGVYAASEGLSTVIVEREAPGGQAGQSSSIENCLGFPKGLSGSDLAQRALAQVSRFGAELVLARDVVGFEQRGPVRAVLLEGGGEVEARSVVVATGVSYRRLEADGIERLHGRGVYYGASASEAAQCRDDVVYVVGGANSAGQAALNLARYAERVELVVRAAALEATMSAYLIERVAATPTITVRHEAEVAAVEGDGHLERLTVRDRRSGATEEVEASWLFVFIGASPRTDWLGAEVARDAKGFVLTGPEVLNREPRPAWPLARAPYALETAVPGVFAAGDVRLDSMKRVASAVGEGAMSIYLVHRYLATV
jgi:thioredoxin reductase (NADPH)